jgi:hypothetical protein
MLERIRRVQQLIQIENFISDFVLHLSLLRKKEVADVAWTTSRSTDVKQPWCRSTAFH